jgi:hypothetical protein
MAREEAFAQNVPLAARFGRGAGATTDEVSSRQKCGA